MTIEELILIDKHKVRRDSNLMSLYLEYFKETFNYLPNCVGCSFGSDWQKFVSYHSKSLKKTLTLQKVKIMSSITIKKVQGKILSYKKDGKTLRLYDNNLNDDFINGFLSNGTDEELAERKKLFNFPKAKEKSFEEIAEGNLSKKESVDFSKEFQESEKIIAKSKRGRKPNK